MVDLRNSGDMRSPSSPEGRRIVVSHRLPLHVVPNSDSPHGGFDFSLDTNALPFKHSRGLPGDVVFIGMLPAAAGSVSASEELAAHLLECFFCIPVFLDEGLHKDFYHGFCMNYLCPLFHDDTLPFRCSGGGGGRTDFKADMYRAYITANTRFADCVSELLDSPGKDHVYIHDYHLLTLPSLLRHRSPSCRIYFTLHSSLRFSGVFCSSPIGKVLVCNLLNADLIAFVSSSWDTRNDFLMVHYNSRRVEGFLSTCSRLLNLSYKSRLGYTIIDYMDRTIVVKSVTCNSSEVYHLREMFSLPETATIAREISTKYMGRTLVLDVEDDHCFYWNRCNNLQAMEKLLESQPELRGEVVLVKINNTRNHLVSAETLLETRDRINSRFGFAGYEPVVVIDDPSMLELLAFYSLADVLIANKSSTKKFIYYTVCGDDGPLVANAAARAPCNGTMLATGRRDDDGGTIMAGIMGSVLMMNDEEKQKMQEEDNPYRYIMSKHDADYWTESFEKELDTVRTYDESAPSFEKLSFSFLDHDDEVSPQGSYSWFNFVMPIKNQEYHGTGRRSWSILQDYNDIVSRQGLKKATTTMELVQVLHSMWSDPNNTTYVGGRRKDKGAICRALHKMLSTANHGDLTSSWRRTSTCSVTMPGYLAQLVAACNSSASSGQSSVAMLHPRRPRFLLDSGASMHVVGDPRLLHRFRHLARAAAHSVTLPDGSRLPIIGVGSIQMHGFSIPNVYLVEGLTVNLVSVSQLATVHNICCCFYQNRCQLMTLADGRMRVVGEAVLEEDYGVYGLRFLRVPEATA